MDTKHYLHEGKEYKKKGKKERSPRFNTLEKVIIDHLKVGKDKGISLPSLGAILEKQGFGDVNPMVLYENLKRLKEEGVVSVNNKNDLNKYFLTHVLGAHEQRSYQNIGWYRNLTRYLKGGIGAILIGFGLGFLFYQNTTISGAIISSTNLSNGNFILPTISIILGGLLIFRTYKK
jgi:hypothetical protein